MTHNKQKYHHTSQKFLQQVQFNQRQYRCKCTKVYKSYPALYTHIKNKHSNKIQQYKNQSKRPKQGQIDKGRPKKHKQRPIQVDQQGDMLNIIELGILQIEQSLRNQTFTNKTQQKFQILQGNSKLQYQQLKNRYIQQKNNTINKIRQTLAQDENNEVIEKLQKYSLNELSEQQGIKIFKQQIKFKNELIQHFNEVTAAKILIELQLLQIQKSDNNIGEQIGNELDLNVDKRMLIKTGQEALWGNNEQIIKVIRNIFQKWNIGLNRLKSNILKPQIQINDSENEGIQNSQNSISKSNQQRQREEALEFESNPQNQEEQQEQAQLKQNDELDDINEMLN